MIRLLKTLPVTAVAALGIAATAYAQGSGKTPDSRLDQAFDSTIVSTYPDGREAELWLKRDGSYTAEGRRHDRSNGTWQVKDDKGSQKLCLKQRRPFPWTFCTGVPEGGADKPWDGKAPTGEQTRIRVVKGIYDPGAKGAKPEEAARRNNNG
jgi:hypothetical protein